MLQLLDKSQIYKLDIQVKNKYVLDIIKFDLVSFKGQVKYNFACQVDSKNHGD